MSSFSETLKKLRLKKNVTQAACAASLGMSKQAFSLYETAQREPDFEMVKRIAAFFDCDVGYLMTGKEPKISDSSLKFALFGDAEIDDEVLSDVKRLALLHYKMRKQEENDN